MSLKQMAVFCCGFLMLSLTHATLEQTTACDINLTISKQFYNAGSESVEGNGDINNRSLSAWKWSSHTSPRWIPRVIYEAECQSHHCSYPGSHQHMELNSVPIYSSMLVLTQDPKNRKCFTIKFRKIAVGCMCVRARTSP